MGNYIHLILVSIVSLGSGLILTPLSIIVAKKLGIVDVPDARKVHTRIVTRMGGTAIVSAYLIGLLVYYLISGSQEIANNFPLILGGVCIFFLGLADDLMNLPAKFKFLVQSAIAVFVISQGLVVESVQIPFVEYTVEFGLFGYVLTFFWVVGVCNAINLLDGLDGLAAGLSLIFLVTISIITGWIQAGVLLPLTLPLIGSLLGFLPYNFNPAKTFMGDCGSLFLGYTIAVLTLQGSMVGSTVVTLLIPLSILGIPLFDTLFAIVRRMAVNKKIMEPDREHIHHSFLNKGLSHKQTVLTLYAISIIFSVIGILSLIVSDKGLAGIVFMLSLIIYMFITKLGYLKNIVSTRHHIAKKKREFSYREIGRSKRAKENFISKAFLAITLNNSTLIIIDFILLLVSYLVARYIDMKMYNNSPFTVDSAMHFGYIAAVFFVFMLLRDSYAKIWRYIKLIDTGKYFRTLLMYHLTLYFLDDYIMNFLNLGTDFYIFFSFSSVTLVMASRLLHNYYYNFAKSQVSTEKDGQPIFIYGAGDTGDLLQNFITKSDDIKYRIAGFIDDNSRKKGKYISQYQVLGSIYDIPDLCRIHGVERIFLSTPLLGENTKRLLAEYKQNLGIKIHTFTLSLKSANLNINSQPTEG